VAAAARARAGRAGRRARRRPRGPPAGGDPPPPHRGPAALGAPHARRAPAHPARSPRHPGARRLRAVLAEAAPPSLTRSQAERRLLDLVRAAGLPHPRANARVRGFEADLLWPDERLVAEVDGFAFHASRRAFERDRARDAALAAAGYTVVRVTWRQLDEAPHAVVARLAAALATRTAAPALRPAGSGAARSPTRAR
jgi:very-short-patch-repair endonuclease